MPREGLFPPGLFGGLTDYFADAAPGGALNPELEFIPPFLDQMRRSSGEAVRAGIGGDYEQFGGMLGDAMGPGMAVKAAGLLAPAAGLPWLLKRMWGAPEKVVPAAATAKRVAGGEAASLRGSSKAPSVEEAMKYAEEKGLPLRTAHEILSKQWYTDEINKLANMNQSMRPPPLTERFPPAPDDVVEAPRGLLGNAFKRQRGAIGSEKEGGLLARQANELEREKAWEALEKSSKQAGVKRSPTTGRYAGAGPGVTSPQKKTAIVKKYAQRAQNAIDAGIDPGYFYAKGRDILARTTDSPREHEVIADLFGPTSTQVGPYQNTNYAVRALDQHALGEPINVGLYPNAMRPRIERVLGGEKPWKGYKVDRYGNLLGPADPHRHPLANMPPNDQWEGFGTGLAKGQVPSGPTQVAFTDYIRDQATNKLNKERAAQGLPLLSREEMQELHWAAIRAETEGRPLVLGPNDTIQDALKQFEFQHSWEAEPGMLGGLKRQIPAQQYMDQFSGVFQDPQGKDKLLRAMGSRLQEPMVPGGGVYKGQVAPGMQSRSFTAHTQAGGLDPASMARVDSTEAVRQYMLSQDARAGHQFKPEKSPSKANMFEFNLGKPMDAETAIGLQAKVDELAGGEGLASVVPTATGYRTLNLGMDNKEFAKKMKSGGLLGKPTQGRALTMYSELPKPGVATRSLLESLEGANVPGVVARADSPATREIAGQISDVYKRLEASGELQGSQKLSLALDAWKTNGLEGLRDLVRQGLAPAAVIAAVLGGGQLGQTTGQDSGVL